MPKLWDETIEAHRQAVRDKTLDTTAALVHEFGLSAVTMSQIAKATGIGRATLYKYFPDVESIMVAWHQRQLATHLARLAEIAEHTSSRPPRDRLAAVLTAYAAMSHGHEGSELATLLHRGEHVAAAREQLRGFLRDLLHQAAQAGVVRHDVPLDELVGFCLHALTAAGGLPGPDGVDRLVRVTLDGLSDHQGSGSP